MFYFKLKKGGHYAILSVWIGLCMGACFGGKKNKEYNYEDSTPHNVNHKLIGKFRDKADLDKADLDNKNVLSIYLKLRTAFLQNDENRFRELMMKVIRKPYSELINEDGMMVLDCCTLWNPDQLDKNAKGMSLFNKIHASLDPASVNITNNQGNTAFDLLKQH